VRPSDLHALMLHGYYRTIATCKKVFSMLNSLRYLIHASCRGQKHKVPIDHSARQITTSDFTKFTHILAADESNLRNLNNIKPKNATAEVKLFGSYLDNKPIADPYYGGMVCPCQSLIVQQVHTHVEWI
jgi:protein-tyrosine-phosphatase